MLRQESPELCCGYYAQARHMRAARYSNVKIGIAAAGKNGYGHPHKAVKKAFRERHRIFSKVSSAKSSSVVIEAEF
jgi:hypothetical protein